MRTVRLPLILSVICFLLAALLASLTWRRIFPEVEVVVPKTDLPAGTQLTAENLTRVMVPSAALPADPAAWQTATGKWAAVPLFHGETLTRNRLQEAPPATENKVSSGVLAIPVNGQYALGGEMRPGDNVIIMAVPPKPADNKASTDNKTPVDNNRATILMRDIRVVDVRNSSGQSAAPTDDKAKSASSPLGMPTTPGNSLPSTVILDVTEQQALQLVNAVESKAAIYFYRGASGGE